MRGPKGRSSTFLGDEGDLTLRYGALGDDLKARSIIVVLVLENVAVPHIKELLPW